MTKPELEPRQSINQDRAHTKKRFEKNKHIIAKATKKQMQEEFSDRKGVLLLANSVSRRSWSLCSRWKNPSRTRGWGEVE
jgi:hypothetical protein